MMFPLAAKNCRLMRYMPDNLLLQTRFTMSPWSNALLKIFFPGNFIWKIWRSVSSDQVQILTRALDSIRMDKTSYGRVEQKLIVKETHAHPESLPGIEYVDIE